MSSSAEATPEAPTVVIQPNGRSSLRLKEVWEYQEPVYFLLWRNKNDRAGAPGAGHRVRKPDRTWSSLWPTATILSRPPWRLLAVAHVQGIGTTGSADRRRDGSPCWSNHLPSKRRARV